MATEISDVKPRRRPLPLPLSPVIEPDGWYWSEDVRKTFDMSRETIAELKRGAKPEEVGNSRMGDVLKGSAVIRWLSAKKTAKRASTQ